MDIKKLLTTSLNPAVYNPRKKLAKGDPEYISLAKSITEFGLVDPIIVNKDGTVIGGHQRLTVLKDMGIREIDCVVLDLDKEHEKALNIALNKIAGQWDMGLLKDLLLEIDASNIDIETAGFSKIDLQELLSQFDGDKTAEEDDFDDDAAVAEIETPITQPGDIWKLGKHRLICGDATSSDDISKLMGEQEADLVLTDPPYNVNYEGMTKDKLKINNDKMRDEQFLQFLTDAFTRMYEHSKKGAAIYVFHAESEGFNFRNAFKLAGYSLHQCLIWAKNSMVMGRQDYQWKHEPILYGWKDGAGWYCDRKQTTVINFDRPTRSEEHPTMKPIGLCGYFVKTQARRKLND